MKGKGQLLLPQGEFQRVLLGRLERVEGVEVRLGWSVDDFTQGEDASKVAVQISGPEGETEEIDAAFLVGADGAHSRVRKCMGVELSGETLDAQLVATDLRFPFKSHGFFDANFVVDKADYGLIGRIDNTGLWRVSYGVPGSHTEEDIRRTLDEKLRTMLPNNGKDEAGNDAFEVVRVAPYRAQQRCADTLISGRVSLVGDAAHCKSSLHLQKPQIWTRLTDTHSNQPLRRSRPCLWNCRCRRSSTRSRAHTLWESIRRRPAPLLLV
jgi:2-polyprenyl-6-methoxyphenol hydroxylase-like FAD-dependent oxidoreductase